MSYLIDSDWVIDHLANEPVATRLLTQLLPAGVAISAVTFMEVLQGVLRSPDPQQARADFNAFLANVPVVPFSAVEAEGSALAFGKPFGLRTGESTLVLWTSLSRPPR